MQQDINRFKKEYLLRTINTLAVVSSFLGQTIRFRPIFQKSVINDHKGPENINYTKVKYGETFHGTNTSCSKDIYIVEGMTLESNENTHKTENS